MVDLSTFSNNVDSTRFEQTMQSTRTAGVKPLYISDKGIPKTIVEEIPRAEQLINEGKNIEASVFLTEDGVSPAYSFIGDWISNSSQVLVYYQPGYIPPEPPPAPLYTKGVLAQAVAFADGYYNANYDPNNTEGSNYGEWYAPPATDFSDNWSLEENPSGAVSAQLSGTVDYFDHRNKLTFRFVATSLSADEAEGDIEFRDASDNLIYTVRITNAPGFSTRMFTRIGNGGFSGKTYDDSGGGAYVIGDFSFDIENNEISWTPTASLDRATLPFTDSVPNVASIAKWNYVNLRAYATFNIAYSQVLIKQE